MKKISIINRVIILSITSIIYLVNIEIYENSYLSDNTAGYVLFGLLTKEALTYGMRTAMNLVIPAVYIFVLVSNIIKINRLRELKKQRKINKQHE